MSSCLDADRPAADLFPPSAATDAFSRAWRLTEGQRQTHWGNLLRDLTGVGEEGAAYDALSAAVPSGLEHLLDTDDGRASLLEHARRILWALHAHPPTCVH